MATVQEHLLVRCCLDEARLGTSLRKSQFRVPPVIKKIILTLLTILEKLFTPSCPRRQTK